MSAAMDFTFHVSTPPRVLFTFEVHVLPQLIVNEAVNVDRAARGGDCGSGRCPALGGNVAVELAKDRAATARHLVLNLEKKPGHSHTTSKG